MGRTMSGLVAVAWVTMTSWSALAGCSINQGLEPFDETQMVLMQFQDMVPGEDIAIVNTTEGRFTLRFFPSEAPKAVENFIRLAREGFFDGEKVAKIEKGSDADGKPTGRLIAGTNGEADQKGSLIYDSPFKEEISYNLAHFPGAVSAFSTDGSVDSRFFIVGNREVCKSELGDLKIENYPEKIVEKFEKVGGYPEYWLNSSIFAQVVDGLDVVNRIIDNSSGSEPATVSIEKVVIEKYEAGQ